MARKGRKIQSIDNQRKDLYFSMRLSPGEKLLLDTAAQVMVPPDERAPAVGTTSVWRNYLLSSASVILSSAGGDYSQFLGRRHEGEKRT
jgi:hypothetical protein